MYTLMTSCDGNINIVECSTLQEACRLAYKLRGQFCNIQRDSKIIYNRLRVDDLSNVVFENVWKRELLE